MDRFVFNGIDGLTGEPLLSAMDARELAELVVNAPVRPQPTPPEDPGSFGLGFGLDPSKLEDAGWTVVLAADEDPSVREALEDLITWREASGAPVRVLTAEAGEDFAAFMARHGVHPGEVEPEKIGYYLTIAARPAQIPWEFQHHADIEYAVGRLAFDDAEDYARYARSVVATEQADAAATTKRLACWGPRHDRATELSHDELLLPLLEGEAGDAMTRAKPALTTRLKWDTSRYLGDDATKANFLAALAQRPALLLTASHGLGNFEPGSAQQLASQGALLAADWSGAGALGPNDYVSAADIPEAVELAGMITFHFACYSAGTPLRDCFRHREGREPERLAEAEFVSALAKRLLAHPRGSALAVIGHVDRAWGASIGDRSGRHLGPFRNTLGNLMTGKPVGFAVNGFNERYAVLSNLVASLLEKRGFGLEIDPMQLAQAWLGRNEAQNYVVLGDPAVRLRI